MAGIKAACDAAKLLKAAEKETGTGEQGNGESDLDADEQPLQRISSRDLRPAGLRQRAGETAARAANGGNQTAEKSDDHGAGQGIEDDACIEMDFLDPGKLCGQRAEDVRRCRGEKKTEARADEGQEKGFGEQLSNERATRSPQRETNGDFVLTLGGARQEQRNDVRASDEQEERDGAEEQPERPARAGDGIFLERFDGDREVGVRLGKLAAELRLDGS